MACGDETLRPAWPCSWGPGRDMLRQSEVYRREQTGIRMISTLFEGDTVSTSPLPGFTCSVGELFEDILQADSAPFVE